MGKSQRKQTERKDYHLTPQAIKNDAMSVFQCYLKMGTKEGLEKEWLSVSKFFSKERFKNACNFIRKHKDGFDEIERQHLEKQAATNKTTNDN